MFIVDIRMLTRMYLLRSFLLYDTQDEIAKDELEDGCGVIGCDICLLSVQSYWALVDLGCCRGSNQFLFLLLAFLLAFDQIVYGGII